MKFADIADLIMSVTEGENDRRRAPQPIIRVAGRGSRYLAGWSDPAWAMSAFQSNAVFDRPDFPYLGGTHVESGATTGSTTVHCSGLTPTGAANILDRLVNKSQVGLGIATSLAAGHPSGFTAPRPEPRRRELSRAATLEPPPYLALVRRLLERDDIEAARKMLDAVPLDAPVGNEVQRLRRVLAPPRVTPIDVLDVDRSREYRWFRQHWQNYRGQWVAVDGDQVLAAARTLRELRDTLKTLNLTRPPLVHRLD